MNIQYHVYDTLSDTQISWLSPVNFQLECSGFIILRSQCYLSQPSSGELNILLHKMVTDSMFYKK